MQITTETQSVGPQLISPEVAVRLFAEEDYQGFNDYLDHVPLSAGMSVLKQLIEVALRDYDEEMGRLVGRRIAHHPNFTQYWEEMPIKWQQALFYVNSPFLRTRLSLSLFDHPKVPRNEIDYTVSLLDNAGNRLNQLHRTIKQRETHSYEAADLINSGSALDFGIFMVETPNTDLYSLRAYANWYNDHSITTTHEKMALVNGLDLIVVPTIVCDDDYETFLAVSNIRNEPLKLECQLHNQEKQWHQQNLMIDLPGSNSILCPLSKHFSEIQGFLSQGPGALYLYKKSGIGMYYYFIHHKKNKTWQIQHL